ncbi:polysaccharide biosynthesis C-terminal domain-containing protein [Shinella zoogloeoides]|uniref:NAD-dependent epimerase/dehydratase family protein n=1 Tax=Shinella zoogloeoides TaxID=352475 RepID=A0A6N8TJY0_SHIZO|nr:NAD-dependent epimerase/dehydratase family protein [Shinella zoogloeoides]MXO02735.1 NAD-dependent epimerase/dehydratase family protein [Shinella zoogloeoides]UEX80992.1 NAD-dependent epimerase/dehydratase family protein [Shinella zoogloeoides]
MEQAGVKRFVVTGAAGLLGWHACARLHASNCAAAFRKAPPPFDLITLDHRAFVDPVLLREALTGADAVLHFAGINRASDEEIEQGNPAIAGALAQACREAGADPHIVYANSTHAACDTPYGRGKRRAGDILADSLSRYTNLVLPHIFGECARPRYNNVTATFIEQVIAGEKPSVDPDGRVQLLHAGAAAQTAIDAVLDGATGMRRPEPRPMAVGELLSRIEAFHAAYSAGLFPDLGDAFDLALFNSYRAALYPNRFPRSLKLNSDARGTLFEAVKGGGGGQTFVSWTEPGATRGQHFHLSKVERFLVLAGDAVIRIRRVLHEPIWEYRVSGEFPAVIDMPTLHTHSIENVGHTPLLTLFWTQEVFDPAAPDTYADPVMR